MSGSCRKFLAGIAGWMLTGLVVPVWATVVIQGDARFTVVAPELIRMEFDPHRQFVDAPSLLAVNRGARFEGVKIRKKDMQLEIETGKIHLLYVQDGKPFHSENLKIQVHSEGGDLSWRPGQVNLRNLGGTLRTLDQVMGPVDLGEGLLSRDGWYLLDDSKRPLLEGGWVKSRPAERGLDWYFFGYGVDFPAALRAFTKLSGPVPLPRRYAMGSWSSRYWPYSSTDYKNIVGEYHDHDFPLDLMVLDMDWHKDGWTGWSWNRKLLPDAEALLGWFKSRGLHVTLNDHPADGMGPHEEQYAPFMADLGLDPAAKTTVPFDAGNKKYLDTLFRHVHSVHEKTGVDFWWLDWQQYPFTKSIADLSNVSWLNHYYFEHSKQHGLRGQSFSRWGGWGDHRNPIHFSGDAHTGFKMLEFEIPMTSTAGNVGCFYWSHDIGGHWGPRNEESYVRWTQFGALSATLRPHSTRDPDLDRRPWTYSESAKRAMRAAFHLRSVFFPYFYTSAWRAYSENAPLLRPLYWDAPKVEASYQNPQEYFYGTDLLVAPIAEEGKGLRRSDGSLEGKLGSQVVYFPEGEWTNALTGEEFKGPRRELVTAKLVEVPLYAKSGVPIPMQPYRERMSSALGDLTVRVYSAGKGPASAESFVYEDDGETEGYLRGEYQLTRFKLRRRSESNLLSFQILPEGRGFAGLPETRKYIIEFTGTEPAKEAKVNGKSVGVEFHPELFMNTIQFDHPVRESVTLEVELKPLKSKGPSVQGAAALELAAFQARAEALLGKALGSQGTLSTLILDQMDPAASREVTQGLLELGGVGLRVKPAHEYLRPGSDTGIEFFVGNQRLSITDPWLKVTETVCGKKRVLADLQCSPETPCRVLSGATRSEWLGCLVALIATGKFNLAGNSMSVESRFETGPSLPRLWSVVGPFSFDRSKIITSQRYEPEKGRVRLEDAFRDSEGREARWTHSTVNSKGQLDFRSLYPIEDRLAYAATFIESGVDQEVIFRMSANGKIELFMDGVKFHSGDEFRLIGGTPEVLKVKMKAGKHELLVKLAKGPKAPLLRIEVEAQEVLKQSYE